MIYLLIFTIFVLFSDEIALDHSDCPLGIAITALKAPRFVLRRKRQQSHDTNELVLQNQVSRTSSASSNSVGQGNTDPLVFTPRSNLKSTASSGSSSSRNISDKNVSVVANLNESTPTHSGKSQHKNSGKAKRTKSFSQIAAMVRKKKSSDKPESSELSTYKLAPGILKVFGDHVSPGSNYKSVRASTISTAREVVKQALEKYSIENANPSDYVLCDVVGHFKIDAHSKADQDHEEAQWVTEYMRVVNDNEKPLVVQSLWKPAAGRLRRFELMKKIQMDSGCFFINTADNLAKDSSSLSSPTLDSERSSIVSDHALGELTPRDSSSLTYATEDHSYAVPQKGPFLLLIKGFDALLDKLLNPLDRPMMSLGNPKSNSASSKPDVCLYAPDIAPEHCHVHKKISLDKGAHETNIDDINFSIFIDPMPNASVHINGIKIDHLTMLQPGQLVSLGSEYCFIFKDPLQTKEKHLKLSWLDALKRGKAASQPVGTPKVNESVQVDFENAGTEFMNDTADSPIDVIDGYGMGETSDAVERSAVCLSYSYEDEDELLEKVMHKYEERSLKFKLTPAYLLTMMIEHSCACFTESHARKLLLKISSALQSVAWVSKGTVIYACILTEMSILLIKHPTKLSKQCIYKRLLRYNYFIMTLLSNGPLF